MDRTDANQSKRMQLKMLNTRTWVRPGFSDHSLTIPTKHTRTHRVHCSSVKSSQEAQELSPILQQTIPRTATALPAASRKTVNDEQADPGSVAYVAPHPDLWGSDPVLMSGCEVGGPRLRVAVLLSGGVDSSVALRLLLAAGHEVTAFYLQIWFQEDFRNFWDACPWEEDLRYARDVCTALSVPLEVIPMTDAYWERVVSHSVGEIRAGRTPNPDVLCNSRVKFGAFLDALNTRPELAGFDRVASGHYARVVRVPLDVSPPAVPQSAVPLSDVPPPAVPPSVVLQSAVPPPAVLPSFVPPPASSSSGSSRGSSSSVAGRVEARLALTPDAVKDQTYFLAALTPQQLAMAMFPLGGLNKGQVRALAAAAGLATQSRKDSQGICFLGKVKFPEFVREHLGEWPGLIVEEEEHEGGEGGEGEGPGIGTGGTSGTDASGTGGSTGRSTGSSTGGSTGSSTGSSTRSGTGGRDVSSTVSSGGAGRGGQAPTAAVFGGRRVLGTHKGYWFYTVGQRGGIKLPGGPWYVVRRDTALNVVYVSRTYDCGTDGGTTGGGTTGSGTAVQRAPRHAFVAGPFSWASPSLRPDTTPDAPQLYVKVRHGPHAYRCELRPLTAVQPAVQAAVHAVQPALQDGRVPQHGTARYRSGGSDGSSGSSGGVGSSSGSTGTGVPAVAAVAVPGAVQRYAGEWDGGAVVVLDGVDQGLAAGQYAVLYQGGYCLGSAVIQEYGSNMQQLSTGGRSRVRAPPAPVLFYGGQNGTGRHVVLTAAGEAEA